VMIARLVSLQIAHSSPPPAGPGARIKGARRYRK
jgi:hypothetical protein